MDSLTARFPLKGRRVAVAGSGPAFEARASALESAGAEVVRLPDARAFEASAYHGALLAFVASADDVFAQAAATAARTAGVAVCAEGRPGLSDFSVKDGPHLPTPESVARFFKGEGPSPQGLGAFAALLQKMKHDIAHALPDTEHRKAFLDKMAHGPAALAAAAGDLKGAQKHMLDALAKLDRKKRE